MTLRLATLLALSVLPRFTWAQTTDASAAEVEESDRARCRRTLVSVDLDATTPWTSWSIEIEGPAVDKPDTLRAFLERKMATSKLLHRAVAEELCGLAWQIGYHLVLIRPDPDPQGSYRAVLVLEPVTTIFAVNVDTENVSITDLFIAPWRFTRSFLESVFPDDIARHLRLRPGASLEREPRFRRAQYLEEEDRLREYLATEGYFDAKVSVRERPRSATTVWLDVEVEKGARYRVGTVQVEGASVIPTSTIAREFRHSFLCPILFCIGEAGFSRTQLLRDVQAISELYKRRGYPAVRVATNFDLTRSFDRATKKVNFTVSVTERRKVDVVFQGNDKSAFSDERLRKAVTFFEEGSYDEVEIAASADRLRALYQEAGHFEVAVSWQRERFGSGFERIFFTIDQGPRVPFGGIAFRGNQAVKSDVLRSASLLASLRRESFFGGSDRGVTSSMIELDRQRLLAQYRKLGFLDAQVTATAHRNTRFSTEAAHAAEVAAGARPDSLRVEFDIREGVRYAVAGVRFDFPERPALMRLAASDSQKRRALSDYYAQRAAELESVLKLGKSAAWTPDLETEIARTLLGHYAKQGRPAAQVEVVSVPGEVQQQKQIVISVTERNVDRVGKLLVRGNHRTKEWVIREELGLDEGELLTPNRLDEGRQNLLTAGLFRAVAIEVPDRDRDYSDYDADDQVLHMVVRLREREAIRLEGAAGYSTDASWFVEGLAEHRNLAGVGLRADIRAQIGGSFQSLETKLASPHWLSRRLFRLAFQTEASVFARQEDTARFGGLTSLGGSLAITKVGRRGFFRGWSFQLRYDVRRRNRDVALVRAPGPSDDLTQAPVTTWTGTVGPSLVIDKRKDAEGNLNPLAPERGIKLEFRAGYSDRFLSFNLGKDRFIKFGLGAQYLWRVNSRVVISNTLRYDHGVPLSREVDLLPDVERYFAGGDTTVRGFGRDRLATEIIEDILPPFSDVAQFRVIPAGGNIRAIYNVDFQVKLWKLGGMPVSSAVFFDAGLVRNALRDLRLANIRPAVGLAILRLNSPFGAFSLEYAVPLLPRLGDDPRGHWHINIGIPL